MNVSRLAVLIDGTMMYTQKVHPDLHVLEMHVVPDVDFLTGPDSVPQHSQKIILKRETVRVRAGTAGFDEDFLFVEQDTPQCFVEIAARLLLSRFSYHERSRLLSESRG